jgi:hypothetical protein
MTYEEMENLKSGARIKIHIDGKYEKATFMRHSRAADSAIWVAYDKDQAPGGSTKETKIYTGMQFNPEYWNERRTKDGRFKKYLLLTDEELDQELMERMGATS